MFALITALGPLSAASASEYSESIIEKNLFHDQRQKWEIEKAAPAPAAPEPAAPKAPQDIDKISLYGTVIADGGSFAVLRSKKKGSSNTREPYGVGDFVSGYLVAEIHPRRVLLQDPTSKQHYELFINDGQKDRTAVKTEIKADVPEKPSGQRKPFKKSKKKPPPRKAQTADFLRKRFEKDLKMLRQNKNDIVVRQAERDYKKLKRLIPYMSEKDTSEILKIKREFDRIKK